MILKGAVFLVQFEFSSQVEYCHIKAPIRGSGWWVYTFESTPATLINKEAAPQRTPLVVHHPDQQSTVVFTSRKDQRG